MHGGALSDTEFFATFENCVCAIVCKNRFVFGYSILPGLFITTFKYFKVVYFYYFRWHSTSIIFENGFLAVQ